MTEAVLTGVGLVTPLGAAAASTWSALVAGRLAVPDRCEGEVRLLERAVDEALAQASALIPGARPSTWRGREIGVRAGLAAAFQAAAQADLASLATDGDRVALIVAGHNLTGDMGERVAEVHRATPAYVAPSVAVRMWDSDSVGLISEALGVHGEAAVVGGASASGLVAVVQAERMLGCGAADVCVVVAPASVLCGWQIQALRTAGAMRAAHHHAGDPGRPFDETADGFVPSQVAGAAVLERAEYAARRRVRPIVRHRGAVTLLAGSSGPEPDPTTQARVALGALEQAGLEPAGIDYVNAHGTGSPRGDACELAALGQVFRASNSPPLVSSTKALLGHGLTSAGLVEYIVTALQLQAGALHPMPRLRRPIAHHGIRLRPDGGRARLRSALTTSYGFGGIHAAAVLSVHRET